MLLRYVIPTMNRTPGLWPRRILHPLAVMISPWALGSDTAGGPTPRAETAKLRRSSMARPNIDCFTIFPQLLCPSMEPILQHSVRPAFTA